MAMKDGFHLQINYIPSTLLPGARLDKKEFVSHLGDANREHGVGTFRRPE
jgi:hypothetical protein